MGRDCLILQWFCSASTAPLPCFSPVEQKTSTPGDGYCGVSSDGSDEQMAMPDEISGREELPSKFLSPTLSFACLPKHPDGIPAFSAQQDRDVAATPSLDNQRVYK